LLSHGPLEVGVAELLAEHVEQIEVLLPEPPGGADRIVRWTPSMGPGAVENKV
jgi:hypothetical protein